MTAVHLPLDPPCFLPLRRRSLARHIAHGTIPDAPLEQAGLLAAQLCRHAGHAAAEIDRLLHDACALFDADQAAAAQHLTGTGGQSRVALETWLEDLANRGILLAPDDVLERFLAASPRRYPGLELQAAGMSTLEPHSIRWPALSIAETDDAATDDDPDGAIGDDVARSHAVERSGLYTSEQARVLRAIAANPDELIDLEAYAGTGKGHLVLALMDARPGRYTYVAPLRGQVDAFRARLPSQARARLLTQVEFANLVARHAAAKGRLGGFAPTYRWSTLPLADVAARIGLQGIGRRSPAQVLMTVLDGINTWCNSASDSLQSRHFTRLVAYAHLDATPYVMAAEHVWRCMFDPEVQKGGCLSLNVGHIGKWLWLHGVAPPPSLGMILVDEAHDLSPAWKALLERHAPGVVSLGDPHQRLTGHAPRWSSSKRLEMAQSVRQGSQVDALVNHSLSLDGLDPNAARFEGALDRATAVHRYTQWSTADAADARLYGSPLRLLQDASRLMAQGASIHIDAASLREVVRDAEHAISALRSVHEGGPVERWKTFVRDCEQRGYTDLPQMFHDGFNGASLEHLRQGLVAQEQARVVLSLAAFAKSVQYRRVAMAACCFKAGYETRASHDPVRAAYVALTRGSQQLWVPEDAADQLQLSSERHRQAKEARRQQRRVDAGDFPRR